MGLFRFQEQQPGSLEHIEKTLKTAGEPYQWVNEDQLYRVGREGYLMVLLPETLNRRTLLELQAYLADGGKLILIPAADFPDHNTTLLLSAMKLNLDGSAYTAEALPLNWQNGNSATHPALEATLPLGTRLLTIRTTPEVEILARWGKVYPAIIESTGGIVLNWNWGRDLPEEANIQALRHILARHRAERMPLQAATPPIQPLKAPAQEHFKEIPGLKTELFIPTTATSLASAPASPTEPQRPDASVLVAELIQPEASPPEETSDQSPAIPPSLSPQSQPANPLNTVEPAPQALPPAMPDLRLAAPAQQASPAAEPFTDPLFNDTLMAPGKLLTTPQQPAQNKAQAPGGDPLLDDSLMGGDEGDNASLFSPLKSGHDYGSFLYRIQQLDQYDDWVEDAVESALQLSIPIPVKKTQQLLIQADIHKAKAQAANDKGDYWKAEYEYEEAYRLLSQALVLTTVSSKVEGRAIWLDRGSIVDSKNPQGLRKLIQKLDDAGINVVYFETLNAGFPIYPSKLLPGNPLVEGWDPLAVAIEEAHKRGMELHAWVWCFAVGNMKHNPLVGKTDEYMGPVLEEAGLINEALKSQNGSLIPPGQHEYWLSPASPRAQEFLRQVYKEIVSQYDVDGLQLDYIRYPFQRPNSQVGFEPVSRTRFYNDTGIPLGEFNDSTLKSFIAWKTLQVSNFVRDVSDDLRTIKPDIKLSAAVFPMERTQRILAIQQDWETWIEKGWIDTLSPMIYTSSRSIFQSTVSRVIESTNKKAMVYPGIAIFRLDPAEMLGHLEAIREKGGMGSTLFAFAHLDQPKRDALREGPYKERHAIPPHKSPLNALNTLVKSYQTHFIQLADRGELATLNPGEIQDLKNTLRELDRLTGETSITTGKPHLSDAMMASLKNTVKLLDGSTRRWLETEKDRPFRARFFSESMARISQMLDYAEKQSVVAPQTATY